MKREGDVQSMKKAPSITGYANALRLLILLAVLVCPLWPAFADDVIGDRFCHYADMITSIVPVLVLIAVMIIGVMAMLGKISWDYVVLHLVAATVAESAVVIVNLLVPAGSCT